MPKPGRNAQGQWLTNDATGQQALEALISAIEIVRVGVWLHTDQALEFDGHIATAKAAAGLADAGERPGTEQDNAADRPG
jgi:hypothetical protein